MWASKDIPPSTTSITSDTSDSIPTELNSGVILIPPEIFQQTDAVNTRFHNRLQEQFAIADHLLCVIHRKDRFHVSVESAKSCVGVAVVCRWYISLDKFRLKLVPFNRCK